MFFIKQSEIIKKINDQKFRKKIINYTLQNKCCLQTNCNHPKYQSNASLHLSIDVFKNSILKELNFNIKKLWSFWVPKGSRTLESWHKHGECFSCLMYLTENDIITKFENFEIKLKPNNWLVWDENLLHTPEEGIVKKDRLVIAGTLEK